MIFNQENPDLSKGGIYQIRNLINNKVYVGLTKNFKSRYKQHFSNLSKGKHVNNHLQYSFNKHGIENFIFEVLEYCDTDYIKRENHYMLKLKSSNDKFGYNIIGVDENGFTVISKETKKKISETLKGNKNCTKEYMGEKKWNKLLQGRSDRMKNNTMCSKEGFIERHGELEGVKKYNSFVKKQSENSKGVITTSLPLYIERYGKINATIKWNEFLETNKLSQKTRKRISIDGIVYESLREAERETGTIRITIRRRCENPNFKEYKFI